MIIYGPVGIAHTHNSELLHMRQSAHSERIHHTQLQLSLHGSRVNEHRPITHTTHPKEWPIRPSDPRPFDPLRALDMCRLPYDKELICCCVDTVYRSCSHVTLPYPLATPRGREAWRQLTQSPQDEIRIFTGHCAYRKRIVFMIMAYLFLQNQIFFKNLIAVKLVGMVSI